MAAKSCRGLRWAAQDARREAREVRRLYSRMPSDDMRNEVQHADRAYVAALDRYYRCRQGRE